MEKYKLSEKNEERTIAIIGESFGATGKGLYPVEITKALNNIGSGYKIKLFMRDTAPYNSESVIKIKTFKTKIRLLTGLGYYIPLFFKLYRDKSIDLIHAYDEKTGFVANFLNKPKIITVCDLYPLDYTFPFNLFFRFLYKFLNKAEYITPISFNTGNQLSNAFPSLSKKIVPIHLGVDVNRFRPSLKKKKDCINIGVLCNLDKELIDVFDKILQEYPNNVKIIIGGRDIPKKFDYLKLRRGVIFKGFIKESDLSNYYQNIDIFVYKTDIAAFELIPLEAMASGCAVIASDIGALKEVVDKRGLLVENTKKEFYTAIKKLINNKALRLKYQKSGRKRARELTWKNCAKKYLNIYSKVMNKA